MGGELFREGGVSYFIRSRSFRIPFYFFKKLETTKSYASQRKNLTFVLDKRSPFFPYFFLKNVLFNGVYNKIEVFRLFFSIACMILHDYDDIVRRDIDECYGNNGGNFSRNPCTPNAYVRI